MLDFKEWLKVNTKLKKNSIKHYAGGVNTVSNTIFDISIFSETLNVNALNDLNSDINMIFKNEKFIAMNSQGNNMYSCALKYYGNFIYDLTLKTEKIDDDIIKNINNDNHLKKTQKTAIVQSRIGQGEFRNALIKKYGKCLISDVDNLKLLVASHIKPWTISDNKNRLSVNNGLLLSATYDKLFDRGLITFNNQGKIFLSPRIGAENENRLHLIKDAVYDIRYNDEMKENLQYHNDVIFIV